MNCDKENPQASTMDFEDDKVLDNKGKDGRPWPALGRRALFFNKAHLPMRPCHSLCIQFSGSTFVLACPCYRRRRGKASDLPKSYVSQKRAVWAPGAPRGSASHGGPCLTHTSVLGSDTGPKSNKKGCWSPNITQDPST